MLLETRNLTKQYGHYKAVNGVSLHIKKGAIYGFIGRNGAGKTVARGVSYRDTGAVWQHDGI